MTGLRTLYVAETGMVCPDFIEDAVRFWTIHNSYRLVDVALLETIVDAEMVAEEPLAACGAVAHCLSAWGVSLS